VHSFTKGAVTGAGIIALAGAAFGLWQWFSNGGKRDREKAKRGNKSSKLDKRSHARSWTMDHLVESKWTGASLSTYN